jgi:hypothetical protein
MQHDAVTTVDLRAQYLIHRPVHDPHQRSEEMGLIYAQSNTKLHSSWHQLESHVSGNSYILDKLEIRLPGSHLWSCGSCRTHAVRPDVKSPIDPIKRWYFLGWAGFLLDPTRCSLKWLLILHPSTKFQLPWLIPSKVGTFRVGLSRLFSVRPEVLWDGHPFRKCQLAWLISSVAEVGRRLPSFTLQSAIVNDHPVEANDIQGKLQLPFLEKPLDWFTSNEYLVSSTRWSYPQFWYPEISIVYENARWINY